ncbi:MAG TPA: hypothetical protein VJ852_09240 [Gemmatimonadaceae bacterium]|nr:hypothetical protein [Gemmatimonadaceae bacterium]
MTPASGQSLIGIRRGFILAVALIIAGLGCHDSDARRPARRALVALLSDSVGAEAHPQTSFIVDINAGGHPNYKHLQLEFDTVAFSNMSDSAFAARSRHVAALAASHYTGGPLDSVTVLVHDSLGPGAWRIVRMQSYAVRDLSGQSPAP